MSSPPNLDSVVIDALEFHKSGNLREAERLYKHVLGAQPQHLNANHNFGLLLLQVNNPQAALPYFAMAIQAGSRQLQHWSSLVECLLLLGRGNDALSVIEDAQRQGLQEPEAAKLKQRVMATRASGGEGQSAAEAQYRIAVDLHARGRLQETEAAYRRAIELAPGMHAAHSELGRLLVDVGQLSEGEASYRRAIEILTDNPVPYINLGNVLAVLGRPHDAKKSFLLGLALKPDWQEARSSYLCFLAYTGIDSHEAYLAQARDWERYCVPAQSREVAKNKSFRNAALAGRRLRIGYVSGDFRNHPVSVFMAPLLANHDRERVEVFAYSSNGAEDNVTRRLRQHVDHWHSIPHVTDESAVELVASHKIDVLIDLSGHTRLNRLGIFARRAAPVQCHYLGYFASTGLSEMDYWIADPVLIPEEQGPQYCEKIWRLPRAWVSGAMQDGTPDPVFREKPEGRICLGSFNHLGKITDRTLELWAKVLHAIPKAYLFLKTKELEDAKNRNDLLAKFNALGIPESRIELRGRVVDWTEHMSLYNELDISLDTLSTGATTTCDALLMGTPVVTLAGSGNAERMTASMLVAIGQKAWIAEDDNDYVHRVEQLASNPAVRKRLRTTLRGSMLRSSLFDARGLAKSMEDAFEQMFERWDRQHNKNAR